MEIDLPNGEKIKTLVSNKLKTYLISGTEGDLKYPLQGHFVDGSLLQQILFLKEKRVKQ